MKITNRLKEKFCKDFSLPIKIYDEPYFTSRLNLFDPYYGCVKKYKIFLDELEKYENEEEYYKIDNEMLDNIINDIKNNIDFITFSNSTVNPMPKELSNLPSKDIYQEKNIDRNLLSIDLKQANFQTLKKISKTIFFNCNTWEEFISLYTQDQTKIESKHLRQVIFGACNPSKTISTEKYNMSCLLKEVFNKINNLKIENVIFFAADEIVFDIDNIEEALYENIINQISKICKDLDLNCHIHIFKLEKKNYGTYKKTYVNEKNKKPSYKKTNPFTLPFIIREENNEEPIEEDYYFIYEKTLCKASTKPN